MNPAHTDSESDLSRSGWTIQTLYLHFASLLVAQKEAVGLAQTAADRAMNKAEGATEKRFEGVNEFRARLADQQRMLMPRAEAEVFFKNMEIRLAALEKINFESNGSTVGLSTGWALAIAAIGFITGIVGLIGFLFTLMRGEKIM